MPLVDTVHRCWLSVVPPEMPCCRKSATLSEHMGTAAPHRNRHAWPNQRKTPFKAASIGGFPLNGDRRLSALRNKPHFEPLWAVFLGAATAAVGGRAELYFVAFP